MHLVHTFDRSTNKVDRLFSHKCFMKTNAMSDIQSFLLIRFAPGFMIECPYKKFDMPCSIFWVVEFGTDHIWNKNAGLLAKTDLYKCHISCNVILSTISLFGYDLCKYAVEANGPDIHSFSFISCRWLGRQDHMIEKVSDCCNDALF